MRLMAAGVSLLVLGCGSSGDSDPVVPDGQGPGDKADGAPGTGPDGGAQLPVSFHIALDYRFDEAGFFDAPERRATLEAAAAAWGRIFANDYPAIPAGTQVRTRNPETPYEGGMGFAVDAEIDDLLIFVGCSRQDGDGGQTAVSNHTAAIEAVADPVFREELRARYRGSVFQPWTGWISFDCDESWYFDPDLSTDADIPGTDSDFYTVAMHEMGHVLGFGTADAFMELREEAPMRFTGPVSVTEHGGDVPLSSSGAHLESGLLSDGQATLMDPSRAGGTRAPPTPLDIAVLVDLGHTPE